MLYKNQEKIQKLEGDKQTVAHTGGIIVLSQLKRKLKGDLKDE